MTRNTAADRGPLQSGHKTSAPDHAWKTYFEDPEHFADLFNAALFRGKYLLEADKLSLVPDPERLFGPNEIPHSVRIVQSDQKHPALYQLLILDKDASPDEALVLDVELSEAAGYIRQLTPPYPGIHSDGSDGKKRSRDKMPRYALPILSLVLYCGTEPWNAPVSLEEMFDPEVARKFPDTQASFGIHVFQARLQKADFRNQDNIDLFAALRETADTSGGPEALSAKHLLNRASEAVRLVYQAVTKA